MPLVTKDYHDVRALYSTGDLRVSLSRTPRVLLLSTSQLVNRLTPTSSSIRIAAGQLPLLGLAAAQTAIHTVAAFFIAYIQLRLLRGPATTASKAAQSWSLRYNDIQTYLGEALALKSVQKAKGHQIVGLGKGQH